MLNTSAIVERLPESMRREISEPEKLFADLKREIAHTASTRYLHRLHCVWLVHKSGSCQRVAEWFGESRRTIERWVREYEEQGADGLLDRRKPGRPPRISNEMASTLIGELAMNPEHHGYTANTWTGRLLKKHLHSSHEVDMSLRQCQRLLHRFGAVDEQISPSSPPARPPELARPAPEDDSEEDN